MPDQGQNYLSGLGEVLIFLIVGILFVTVALLVSKLLRPHHPNVEKLSSYESGEEARGESWVQFNLRFYVIALIFLLFEVEIVLMFPWATIFADKTRMAETNGLWGEYMLYEMIIFVGVLALGLAYAWVNGHLEWIKPAPRTTEFTSPVPKEFYDKLNERYK